MSEIFSIDRASISSDDVAGHGAEFVEREFRAIRDGVSDLYFPEGVPPWRCSRCRLFPCGIFLVGINEGFLISPH